MHRNSRIKTHEEVQKELQDLKKLVQTDPETAKIIARIALIKTGVLDESGSSKGQIIDYPHIGYYSKPKRRVKKR